MPILTQKEVQATFTDDEEDGDETRLETSIALLQLDQQHLSVMDSSISRSMENSSHDHDTTNDHLKENIAIEVDDNNINAGTGSNCCVLQQNSEDHDDGTGYIIIDPKQ